MIKKILALSTVILAVSVIFSACSKNDESKENSSADTTATTARVYATDYTYITYTNPVLATSTTREHIVPPVPTSPKKNETIKADNTVSTTAKINHSSEDVEEISNGISIITKTSPVIKGNFASIIISGAPNKEYSIEFYEITGKKASYTGLENTKSDSSGFASWTFEIKNTCDTGERKIIVREKGTNNFVQTTITIQ